MQLKEGSEFLENQKEDLISVWGGFKRNIFSFYETVKTPTVIKVNSDVAPPLSRFAPNFAYLV
jgi:hypothetical protein